MRSNRFRIITAKLGRHMLVQASQFCSGRVVSLICTCRAAVNQPTSEALCGALNSVANMQ